MRPNWLQLAQQNVTPEAAMPLMGCDHRTACRRLAEARWQIDSRSPRMAKDILKEAARQGGMRLRTDMARGSDRPLHEFLVLKPNAAQKAIAG